MNCLYMITTSWRSFSTNNARMEQVKELAKTKATKEWATSQRHVLCVDMP